MGERGLGGGRDREGEEEDGGPDGEQEGTQDIGGMEGNGMKKLREKSALWRRHGEARWRKGVWGRPAEKGWGDGSREGPGRPEADGQRGWMPVVV